VRAPDRAILYDETTTDLMSVHSSSPGMHEYPGCDLEPVHNFHPSIRAMELQIIGRGQTLCYLQRLLRFLPRRRASLQGAIEGQGEFLNQDSPHFIHGKLLVQASQRNDMALHRLQGQPAEGCRRHAPHPCHRLVIEVKQQVSDNDAGLPDPPSAHACNPPATDHDFVYRHELGWMAEPPKGLDRSPQHLFIEPVDEGRGPGVVENELIKELVRIQIGSAATKPPTIDWQLQALALIPIHDGLVDLVITEANMWFIGLAQDDGVWRIHRHALGDGMIEGLCLPGRYAPQIDQPDRFGGQEC